MARGAGIFSRMEIRFATYPIYCKIGSGRLLILSKVGIQEEVIVLCRICNRIELFINVTTTR